MNKTEYVSQTDYGGTNHLNFFDSPYTSHNLSNDDDFHPSNNDGPHGLGGISESDDTHHSSDDESDSDASVKHDGSGNEGRHSQSATLLHSNSDGSLVPSATLLEPSEDTIDPNIDGISEDNIRSKRNSVMPLKFQDYVVEGKVKYAIERVVNYSKLSSENFCFVSKLNQTTEPKNVHEAFNDPNWKAAMNIEMESLYKNKTFTIIELPVGRKLIGNKWVWKLKFRSTSEIERYKARLVAKGSGEKEGVDYDETFSPVVKMATVRCLISLAVNKGWTLYQLDINNAFLYGDLDEDVSMTLPEGYFNKDGKRVCKLNKSLYGLKQAPRKWNEKLTSALKENGFRQSKSDYSLFIKSQRDLFIALLVYVDDIVLTGNNLEEIEKFKSFLKSKFLIKDLGKLKYFLGIEVIDTNSGLCLNQRKYCLELLAEYGLLASKPTTTPIETNVVVSDIVRKKSMKRKGKENVEKEDLPLTDLTGYQKLIGKLIYLTLTRLDISYTVHSLSQFMHKPLQSHVKLAMRVLRYLKGSPGKGIVFNKSNDLSLKAYVDSDWAKCPSTRKSVTGFLLFFW